MLPELRRLCIFGMICCTSGYFPELVDISSLDAAAVNREAISAAFTSSKDFSLWVKRFQLELESHLILTVILDQWVLYSTQKKMRSPNDQMQTLLSTMLRCGFTFTVMLKNLKIQFGVYESAQHTHSEKYIHQCTLSDATFHIDLEQKKFTDGSGAVPLYRVHWILLSFITCSALGQGISCRYLSPWSTTSPWG